MQWNVYWIIALILLLAALAGMAILIRRRHRGWEPDEADYDEAMAGAGTEDAAESAASESPIWGRVDIMVEGRRISTQRVLLGTTMVGRDPARAQIVIPELIVSKEHCELFVKAGNLWIRDAGSTNGLFREGEQIQEGEVTHGAVYSLGRRGSVKLMFFTDPPLDH